MTPGPRAGRTLTGRTALVTGAGGPLGRAMAVALATADATSERAWAMARTQRCDVSDPDSVAALAAAVGEVSILINNAGIAGPVRGPRMDRNFRLEAAATGTTPAAAEAAFASRAALNRLVEADEVGCALITLLTTPALCGIDLDLSAGMFAPA